MKSRFTALLMAGVMGVTCLAGCSGSGAGSNKTADNQNQDTGEQTDAGKSGANTDSTESKENGDNGETYNVVMSWPNLTGSVPAGMADVEAAINAITEPEIGVTVTFEPIDFANLASEQNLMISSGEKLDLIVSVGSGVSSLVNNGSIIPLDDLYAQYGEDIKNTCGVAVEGGGYYDNVLYGIPNAYIQGESYGFVGRKDIFDKYGITIDPDKMYTYDELEEMFATIKAGEGDSFYMISNITNNTDLFSTVMYPVDTLGATNASGILLFDQNDSDWSDDTTIVNEFATEEYKEYAQRMYRWAQAGYIAPDAASNTDSTETLVKGGNYLGQMNWTTPGLEESYTAGTGYEMIAIHIVPPYIVGARFQNILWSIPITCENPEKTFQFLNMLYGDNDLDTLLQFGIEGVSYEVVEENEYGDRVIKYPDGLDSSSVPYYQAAGIYGNRLSWPVMSPSPLELNQALREFNDSITLVSPAMGYCFVTDSVQSQYAAVQSVISQYAPIVTAGAIDPETEIPEFLAALEAAGINEIIEENQRQFDEWLATHEPVPSSTLKDDAGAAETAAVETTADETAEK